MRSPVPTRLRLMNKVRAHLDASFLSDAVLALPSVYYIGLCAVCNIRCPYCPRQNFPDEVDNGLMSFEEFKKIIEYLNYAEIVFLFGIGEPFLHPQFFDFVREAKKTGIRTSTNTHGMSLNAENREKIIETGLDEISISFDGADEKVFNFLRAGADFKTVVGNIAALQSLKKERGSQAPELQFATVISRHNVRQMPDLVQLARKLGIKKIVFTNLITLHEENAEVSVAKTDLFADSYEKAKLLGKRLGVEIEYWSQHPFPWKKDPMPEFDPERRIRYACPDLWRLGIIDRTGNLKSCCYYENMSGNVFQTPVPDVFNNDLSRALRRSLLDGRLMECCVNCGMLRRASVEIARAELENADAALADARATGLLADADIRLLESEIKKYRTFQKELS